MIISSLGSSKFQTMVPRGRELIVETTITTWTTLMRLGTSRFSRSQAKASASSVSDRLDRTIIRTITSTSIRWRFLELFSRNKHKSFLFSGPLCCGAVRAIPSLLTRSVRIARLAFPATAISDLTSNRFAFAIELVWFLSDHQVQTDISLRLSHKFTILLPASGYLRLSPITKVL